MPLAFSDMQRADVRPLYLVVAELAGDRSEAVRESYSSVVPLFLEMATRAEQALGSSEEDALQSTKTAVADIVELYQARARQNMAASGSYLADDSLMRSDVQVCGALSGSGSSGVSNGR